MTISSPRRVTRPPPPWQVPEGFICTFTNRIRYNWNPNFKGLSGWIPMREVPFSRAETDVSGNRSRSNAVYRGPFVANCDLYQPIMAGCDRLGLIFRHLRPSAIHRGRSWLASIGRGLSLRTEVDCGRKLSLVADCGRLFSVAIGCSWLRSIAAAWGRLRSIAVGCDQLWLIVVGCSRSRPMGTFTTSANVNVWGP